MPRPTAAPEAIGVVAAIALATGIAFEALAAGPLAFPDAVGFGRHAVGWRGGEVVAVTTLADRGPGSLRRCAGRARRGPESDPPRVCVFRVAGTIALERPLHLRSNLYVAGQTAPGGVQLRLARGAAGKTPVVIRDAHDVVVRFLRIRPGAPARPSPSVDALTVEDARNVYLDHLSLQFATDENFNVHANRAFTGDVTLADSIVAFGLDRSNHPKGRHSKGALVCSTERRTGDCGRVTLAGNLFAHNRDRNPDVKATHGRTIEIVGNVFYDAVSQFGEFYDLVGDTHVVYAGNVARPGPSTKRPPPAAVEGFDFDPGHDLFLHVGENRFDDACGRGTAPVVDEAAGRFLAAGRPGDATTPVEPPGRTLQAVLARAGARDAVEGADALDRRILANVSACAGRVVDRVDQAGGWPVPAAMPPEADADGDGMGDAWERTRGLDPSDPGDAWHDADANGWSDLEDFLEHRARLALAVMPPR